ncbi:hypothetical protein KJ693_00710 [bacterium]|nr:hypothetical protein [bacterium]
MFKLEGLNPAAAKRIRPFLEEVLSKYDENLPQWYNKFHSKGRRKFHS